MMAHWQQQQDYDQAQQEIAATFAASRLLFRTVFFTFLYVIITFFSGICTFASAVFTLVLALATSFYGLCLSMRFFLMMAQDWLLSQPELATLRARRW